MRVLVFANNWMGWQVVRWLKQQGEELAGLVVHPPGRCAYGEDILAAAGLEATRVLDASRLDAPETAEAIKQLRPEIGLSILFGYRLPPAVLNAIPRGCLNLHPALLPYNRGAYPNVWSIVDGTPAGATVHVMNGEIDMGDIVSQREVRVDLADTGESLYRKLEQASLELFQETWPLIRAEREPRTPQPKDRGTAHRRADVDRIDEIDLNRSYTARELLNILRARTFPPHPGAYFRDGNRKVYVRVQLVPEEQLTHGSLP